MTSSRRHRLLPVAAMMGLALTGGCSSGASPATATTAPISSSTAASTVAPPVGAPATEPTTATPVTPTPATPTLPAAAEPPPPPPTSAAAPPAPLPGLQGGPVLAVKIDNTVSSRPRLGLNQADVVYVEPVEAGLTRVLAIFSSNLPPEVGPVRSARESDVDLLANYGKVAFAFSGGSAGTLGILARGRQVNLSNDASGQGFRRDNRRPAPYNVIGNTRALLDRASGSVPPGNVGFAIGPPSPGGTPAGGVSTAWPSARIDLAWNGARHQYLVTTDGSPDVDAVGGQHGAATVVVQRVEQHLSGNRDVNGVQTPVVSVIGQGEATVLRAGMAWRGQWSRPDPGAPTAFTAGGQPIGMAAGPIWVLLVPDGQAVQVR